MQTAGLGGVKTAGDPLPKATLDSIRKTRLALKGPLETPSGGGYRSSNVRLREEFKLYANLRPSRTIVPGGRYDNIDLVVVRENNEGLYTGYEHFIPIDGDPHAVAMSTGVNTRQGSRRLLEFAFEYAISHGRKKITIVHKANIMKALTGIFLETGYELYERKYKGQIVVDDVIIDACAMKLVLNPWQFDVLVATNLFGDILSDEIAGLVGGLGKYGAGRQRKPRRGDLRGRARLRARHRGQGHREPDRADARGRHDARSTCRCPPRRQRLRRAIADTLNIDKVRTGDLGGSANTAAFTKAIVARIKNA